MLINLTGNEHYLNDQNNQDFAMQDQDTILIVDGCSQGLCSEAGGRLFSQLFMNLKDHNNPEKFEENISKVFESIMNFLKGEFKTHDTFIKHLENNYYFTILALYDRPDSFEVRTYGDGFIFSKNKKGHMSFMRLNYGDYPPYYGYNYSTDEVKEDFAYYKPRSFSFSKEDFEFVGIASDGLRPVAKGSVKELEDVLSKKGNEKQIKYIIRNNQGKFSDDITIGYFE